MDYILTLYMLGCIVTLAFVIPELRFTSTPRKAVLSVFFWPLILVYGGFVGVWFVGVYARKLVGKD